MEICETDSGKEGEAMSMDAFGLLAGAQTPEAILEYLDNAEYDALSEIDLEKDRLHVLYRTENKYTGPLSDSGGNEWRSYCANRFVHPEDRQVYLSLTDPTTLEQRFRESKYPGILSARYRLMTVRGKEDYRWVEQVLVYGEKFGLPKGILRDYHFDLQRRENRRLGLAFSEKGRQRRDELTGLMVGDSFFPAAQHMLSVPLEGAKWCLLFISIEHLKLFREWFGKEKSDELLSRIGAALRREAAETSGLAGHLWDDDFLLLTPYDRERVNMLYEKLHGEIKNYGFSVGFLPVIGICTEEENSTVLSLADRASLAAASLRGNFRQRIGFYRPEMGNRTKEEYSILSQVQQALKNGELTFYLQPQCLVTTGQIEGAEALVRWRKQDGSMVLPGVFIPVLERYGFISEVDKLVWRKVCAWLRGLLDRGLRPVPISINISRNDILTFHVPDFLKSLMEEYRLPWDLLKLEITESAYVSDMELVRTTVVQLRELGFRVLMDDFGSGYSSLNMLNTLGVDTVKLDAHFLHLDKDDHRGMQILEAVVGMTKQLNLPIIVEGVESEEHVRFLSSLGCRYVQGYHFYRPMPAEEFVRLIEDETRVDRTGIVFSGNQGVHIREFLDESIYSDAMLNNIIGAVAFFAWDGKDRLDILRYNEQFYDLVADPDFYDRLGNILTYMPRASGELTLRMLRRAVEDPLNGADGYVDVFRSNGQLGHFRLKLYHLKEQEERRVFYGSLQEITELRDLQEQIRLISQTLRDTLAGAVH